MVFLPFTLLFFPLIFSFSLGFVLFGAVGFFSAYVKCPFKVWYKEWPIRFRQDFSSRRYQSNYEYGDTKRSTLGRPIIPNHVKIRIDRVTKRPYT